MSEKAPLMNHEQLALPASKPEKMLPTSEQAERLRPAEADPEQTAQQARESVKAIAEQDNPLARLEATETAAMEPQSTHINRADKKLAFQREMRRLRRKLPAPQRVLSKTIHQPAVRAVSEAASKTVSRPSGLLGGGVLAFIGTSGYLYLTKHYGFHYNYMIFTLLFVGGFFVGLALELVVWAATARHRQALID